MNRSRNYLRALMLFMVTAFFSSAAYGQCQLKLKAGALEGCLPHNITLEVTDGSGKGIQNVKWDFGNGNTAVGTLNTQTYVYAGRGTFTPSAEITLNDGTKCNASLSLPIKVYGLPVATFDLPTGFGTGPIQCFKKNGIPNRFCFTETAKRSADNHDIVKWVWNFGDGDTASTDVDPANRNPCHSYQAPGSYNITLQVWDSKGCTDILTKTLSIVVLPDIKPVFNIAGQTGCITSTYTMNNITDTNGILLKSFYWDFGDGSPIDSSNWSPTHTYSKDGAFTITLRIVNQLGCEGTYTSVAKNLVAKLEIKFKDTLCWAGNNVQFEAREIPGAAYWEWNFDDIPSGPRNVVGFDWKPVHQFVKGPGNYNVRFRVQHPICGVFDTCFVVHLKGPMAVINLPPPPAFPANNFVSNAEIASSEFINLKNKPAGCGSINYSYYTANPNKQVSEPEYCNATVLKQIIDTVSYCDGDTQIYVSGVKLQPSNVIVRTIKDSTENIVTWKQTDPYPWIQFPGRKVFYPSSGTKNWQNVHDTNTYTCKLPNLVRFTNNSIKYRLYKTMDDNPAGYFRHTDTSSAAWRDTCKNKNYPFASDSMTYFWRFNDPNGKICTATVPGPAGWECNFSTLAAPYHYYKGPQPPANGCQTVNFRVTDSKIGCSDSTTYQLRQGPPKASYTRKSDHPNGYCQMTWDLQLYLPMGDPVTNSPALRGFRLANQPLSCTGGDYPMQINFQETLPSCGAQDYWLIFDSAQAAPNNCKDYPWTGAANASGYPIAGPQSTWTGLPWLGNYWYMPGDEGCKTVGVRLKVDNCFDVYWYHDYICFKRLKPQFDMFKDERPVGKLDTARTYIDSSDNRRGRVCHNDPNHPGFDLRLNPTDQTQPLITGFYYGVSRREFPSGDYYFSRPFWPDTATLNPWSDVIDSISARKDTFYIPEDSVLYTQLKDGSGNVIGNVLLSNFYVTPQERDALNNTGQAGLPKNDDRARKVNFYCDTIILRTFKQPMPIKREFYTLNLFDTEHKRRDIVEDSVYNKNTYNHATSHDTVPVRIPYPGFYTIQSQVQNLDGCRQVGQYHLIYGHLARFQLVAGYDSILCVGDTAKFDYFARYWTTNCPPIPGQGPPDGCVNGRIDDYTGILNAWDVADPKILRQNLNPSWTQASSYQNETISWDFGDGSGWQNFPPGKPVSWKYKKPGVFDVIMRTSDSLGCTILTKRHKFIKVIGLTPDFVVDPLSDTLTFCAPKSIKYKDLTTLDGSETNRKGYFEYRDKVVKNGKIIDTVYAIDSIVGWTWDPGDGRPAVTRTETDSVVFVYKKNYPDGLDISLRITTANKPVACTAEKFKSKYIRIIGPAPRFAIKGDTAGCAPFTAVIRNYRDTSYGYQWYQGNGKVTFSRRGDSLVNLTYDSAGRFRIVLLQLDSIYNSFTKEWVTCQAIWPLPEDSIEFWVTVYPHPPVKINAKELVCPKEEVTFTANTSKNVYKTYNWDFGDGTDISGSDSVVKHAYESPGFYKVAVKAITEFDCFEVDTFDIEVDSVIADFSIDTSFAKLGKFAFINHSKGGVRFVWDFGDGETQETTDTNTIVTHQYTNIPDGKKLPTEGTIEDEGSKEFDHIFPYKVCLVVFSRANCTDTACNDLDFKRQWRHINVFTPNNDGKNDVFNPKIKGETSYDLKIYNRWGERVFESNDADYDWNGQVNNTGALCPAGTYYYVWKFSLIGGSESTQKGTVTLLR